MAQAKKWGPYLSPDRFRVPEPGVGDLDDRNNTSEGGKLMGPVRERDSVFAN